MKQFIQDVVTLAEQMNEKFPDSFESNIDGYEKGFRISHAQKSLSICLKHMWCRGTLMFEPPVCPIDGIVLQAANCRDSWTKVNGIEDSNGNHGCKTHLNYVSAVAKNGNCSISEWELGVWATRLQ